MSTNYTTLAKVKAYAGYTTSTDDALITSLIPQATRFIDQVCRRQFSPDFATYKYDVGIDTDNDLLILHKDIAQIDTVVNDTDTLSASDYTTRPRHGGPFWGIKLTHKAGLYWKWTTTPENAISVSGTFGYVVDGTDTPSDIVHAATRLVFWATEVSDRPFEVTALGEVGLFEVPSAVPSDVMNILMRYKRAIVGRRR